MFYKLVRIFLKVFFNIIFLFNIKLINKENFKDITSPILILANHQTNLDPPLLGAFIPFKIRFMAKEELFKIPIFSYLISSLGAFKVKRSVGKDALKKAIDILDKGDNILIFPQGTRDKDNNFSSLKSGAGYIIYKKSDVNVLPVIIIYPDKIFKPLKIVIGKKIKFINYIDEYNKRDSKEVIKNIIDTISGEFLNLYEKNRF